MMGSEGSTSPGAAACCAVCGGAAAVYCAADAAALCGPCDAAVHAANPLASRHERVPLAAAAAAVAAASGVYDDLFAADDVDAASPWAVPPPALGQGSPQGSSEASFATSDTADGGGRSLLDLLSDVDLAVHPCAAAPFWAPPAGLAAWTAPAWSPADAVAAEREARVRRYREKRKNRRFQKTIRYASRKAYAEARPRIKGRFVKRAPGPAAAASAPESDDAGKFWLSFSDDARDDGGLGFFVDAAGAYGVVPSF